LWKHRRSNDPEELRPFDLEIEATFQACQRHTHNLSREANQVQEAIMDPNTTPLSDFTISDPNSVPSNIVRPPIEENNFQFNQLLINLFQQEKFERYPLENLNTHISSFLKTCDTIKMNGVSNDAIWLRLFPFSLKDKVKSWLLNSKANSFTTWQALSKAFLCKYFPPKKTAKLRNDITSFFKAKGESLYEACEGFKELQRECPHHRYQIGCWFKPFTTVCNNQ